MIWSTLEDTRLFVPLHDDRMPTLLGKYKVPDFLDSKGGSNHYFTDLGLPVTMLHTSFYWNNFYMFGMGPKEGPHQRAAHVAFDLRHPEQVAPGARASRTVRLGVAAQAGRWWRARRQRSVLRQPQSSVARRMPVVMVAVDTEHPDDERHPALQWTTRQLISLYPELRLMCISVITAAPVTEGRNELDTRTGRHLEHKTRLRHWVEPLGFPKAQISLHVVEGAHAGSTLLDLARVNHVDLIVLGAPAASQRALAWWRSVASSVTANAHCSVHVVRVPERREEAQTNQT